eukprot:jgi/Ulvmu1/960/UM102_0043.1
MIEESLTSNPDQSNIMWHTVPDPEWSTPTLFAEGIDSEDDGLATDEGSNGNKAPDLAQRCQPESAGTQQTRWCDVLETGAADSKSEQPPNKVHVRARLVGDAAKAKAHREKERRAQLNQKYSELAGMIDPENAFNADRYLILEDSVRTISHLRGETSKMRQLNKQLQEQLQASEARCSRLKGRLVSQQGGLQRQLATQSKGTFEATTCSSPRLQLQLQSLDCPCLQAHRMTPWPSAYI